ncbi:MAG: prepilin-type N-terminal cleavage/methylation domain-containing protein [Candidatus Omnitrophota bacterium]
MPQITNHGLTPLETNDPPVRSKRFLLGFTLVEVMIVVVIFSIIFGVSFDVLLSGRRSFDASSIRYDIQTNAALGLNNMARELKNSASLYVDVDVGGDSVRFLVPVGYSQSGDIIWGADGETNHRIRYEVNGQNQLVRDRFDASDSIVNGTTRILANYVDDVDFDSQPNGLIMNITTSEQNKVTKEWLDENLSSTITFRN